MAKPCTCCGVVQPLTDFPESKKNRDGRDSWCRACYRMKQRQYRAENLEKARACVRRANARRKDELREYHKRWVSENRDAVRQHKRRWRSENLEKAREIERESRLKHREATLARKRAYAKANRELYAAYGQKRRAAMLQAIPGWADLEKIKAVFTECKRITELTGIVHHVDHIIPLRGKTVCGLHVENNLRILEGLENRRKANKIVENLI